MGQYVELIHVQLSGFKANGDQENEKRLYSVGKRLDQ